MNSPWSATLPRGRDLAWLMPLLASAVVAGAMLTVYPWLTTGLVVGVVYLVINLIVDVLYGIIDPRVRLQ